MEVLIWLLMVASCVAVLMLTYEWGWWHNGWVRPVLAAALTALLMVAMPLPPCRPGYAGCTDWPFWSVTYAAMLGLLLLLAAWIPAPPEIEGSPRIPAGFGPLRHQMRGAWRKSRTRKYQGYTVRR